MVLLYRREIWVVMGEMLKVLEVFHNQVARRIAGNTSWRMRDGEWEWTPVADILYISVVWPIKDYIQSRQANIVAHIDCRPIYHLFGRGADKMPGSSQLMRS